MLSQEDQATTTSSRSGSSRKILEASSVGAAKELVVGVHMSPGVMGGTLAGVFLLATLWISVNCFFTIESAPMMVRWFFFFLSFFLLNTWFFFFFFLEMRALFCDLTFFLLFFTEIQVNSPPGPSDGDPQFIGTPKEGTRFYPYMNQAVKEN